MNPTFINTILFGGSTEQKMAAARAAGFQQIELWRQDLESFPGDEFELHKKLGQLHLAMTDYQVLLDFDGAPDDKRDSKKQEALQMLDSAQKLGAGTLLVPASTDPCCLLDRVAEDLKWLAMEAASRGLRIAYEAMAWSTFHFLTPPAWQIVNSIDLPNLGMVIDAFHIFARGRTAQDLADIPVDKIFLVQLSDLNQAIVEKNLIEVARHHRLLPGQGKFPLSTLVESLKQKHYQGPVGLEVFNDELKSLDPGSVAMQAMTALKAVWK